MSAPLSAHGDEMRLVNVIRANILRALLWILWKIQVNPTWSHSSGTARDVDARAQNSGMQFSIQETSSTYHAWTGHERKATAENNHTNK
jgi:hypothetical protein